MNFFCRVFGHTWVHQSENQKVRWSAAKNQSEMAMEAVGEPRFWLECARCKTQRPLDAERKAS